MARKAKSKQSEPFVLDASVAIVWGFEDETDPYAEAVLDKLPNAKAIVPMLWPLEVANALLVGERRLRITEAKVIQFLAILELLPIALDEHTIAKAWHATLQLARSHNLSVYDATYLELALRNGLPLASLDDKLKAAARAAGVLAYKP